MIAKRVLIIHHLQPVWEQGYSNSGTSFEELAKRVMFYLSRWHRRYQFVLATCFEDHELMGYHHESGLAFYINRVKEYGFGWNKSSFGPEDEGIHYCQGNWHSPVIWLPEWMHSLTNYEVLIIGAFGDECVTDLEEGLDFLGIENRRVPGLVVN